ncbi:MAG: hypothetical protein CSA38_05200 [Flavobacteriales bacterium]|nr:MAG: hypothetical protein CSA38_05200 [Flavobacteriales bacterium]
MKKYIISIGLLVGAGAFITTTTQSCSVLATTDVGMSVIKSLLNRGIDKASAIYSNEKEFLSNNQIDKALPSQLRKINDILNKVSPDLVKKEKIYIAKAAAYTVKTSTPILKNTVNNLTKADVARITQGGKGTLTQVLKEKAYQQVVSAIVPKVDEKLNQFGIVKTINTALRGNQNNPATGGISKLASEQIATGLFNIIEKYEKDNKNSILGLKL